MCLRKKNKGMNLNKEDIASVGIISFLGAIVAGTFSLASLYCERKSGALLSVHTDALHVDRILLSYCRELERRTKHIDIINFLQCVDCIDRIVAIRIRLQAKKEKPTKQDVDDTFACLARLRETLKLLVKNCETHMDVRNFIDLERLARNTIEKGLDHHVKTIAALTKDFL